MQREMGGKYYNQRILTISKFPVEYVRPHRCFLQEKDILWPFPPNHQDVRLHVSDTQTYNTIKNISAKDQVIGPLQGDIVQWTRESYNAAQEPCQYVLKANLALEKKNYASLGTSQVWDVLRAAQ